LIIFSLIADRELNLADGSRLLRHDRYDELAMELNLTADQMTER